MNARKSTWIQTAPTVAVETVDPFMVKKTLCCAENYKGLTIFYASLVIPDRVPKASPARKEDLGLERWSVRESNTLVGVLWLGHGY